MREIHVLKMVSSEKKLSGALLYNLRKGGFEYEFNSFTVNARFSIKLVIMPSSLCVSPPNLRSCQQVTFIGNRWKSITGCIIKIVLEYSSYYEFYEICYA